MAFGLLDTRREFGRLQFGGRHQFGLQVIALSEGNTSVPAQYGI